MEIYIYVSKNAIDKTKNPVNDFLQIGALNDKRKIYTIVLARPIWWNIYN